jgi:hypothetical protein
MVFPKGKVPHQSKEWPLEEAMEGNKEKNGLWPLSGEMLSKSESKPCKKSLNHIKSSKYWELAPGTDLEEK